MPHGGCAANQRLDSLRHIAVGAGEALVLTQVFSPGVHKKRLQVAGWAFEVPEDSPLIGSVPAPDTFVSMHCLKELFFSLRLYVIFNCDQNRSGIGDSRILVWHVGHPPMDPGREIDRGIG